MLTFSPITDIYISFPQFRGWLNFYAALFLKVAESESTMTRTSPDSTTARALDLRGVEIGQEIVVTTIDDVCYSIVRTVGSHATDRKVYGATMTPCRENLGGLDANPLRFAIDRYLRVGNPFHAGTITTYRELGEYPELPSIREICIP